MGSISRGPVETHLLPDDGTFPNSALPLLCYRGAVREAATEGAVAFELLFAANGWGGGGRNGVFPYHHYPSTTPEALGVWRGSATVLFGGDDGVVVRVEARDLVVIPAGVAHKALEATGDFSVAASYPGGLRPDMCYGKPGERPGTDRAIALVPIPATDPVAGAEGPLVRIWKAGR
jgi:uncharacterized protein YjlB